MNHECELIDGVKI